jgi:NAD(P)-dependent dehydrogenase (short-subunit alcohol dehydrogenase family)
VREAWTQRPSLIMRFATPDEVAAMVAYVCSGGQASATTGAALRVDGGVVRAILL